MKRFRKQGLWLIAGAGFLLIGLQKQAWAGIPELSSIPSLKESVRKWAPQNQVGPGQKKSEKLQLVFVSPFFTRGQP